MIKFYLIKIVYTIEFWLRFLWRITIGLPSMLRQWKNLKKAEKLIREYEERQKKKDQDVGS